MDYEERLIRDLKVALAKIRAEAGKNKPNPDKIYTIAEEAIRAAAS